MPVVSTFGEGTLRVAAENHLPVKASAPSPVAPSLAKAVDLYITDVLAGKEVEDVEFEENEQNEEFLRTQQSKLAKKSRTRKKA
jgi:uroporphyrinogen-III synthase